MDLIGFLFSPRIVQSPNMFRGAFVFLPRTAQSPNMFRGAFVFLPRTAQSPNMFRGAFVFLPRTAQSPNMFRGAFVFLPRTAQSPNMFRGAFVFLPHVSLRRRAVVARRNFSIVYIIFTLSHDRGASQPVALPYPHREKQWRRLQLEEEKNNKTAIIYIRCKQFLWRKSAFARAHSGGSSSNSEGQQQRAQNRPPRIGVQEWRPSAIIKHGVR